MEPVRVRAKFAVSSITVSAYRREAPGGGFEFVEQHTITMHPVYSNDPGSENKQFWDATPSGKFELGTVNARAAAFFNPGREYYLDLTAAPEA